MNRMRPASSPPFRAASGIGVLTPPCTKETTRREPSVLSLPVASALAREPSTSGWLPATNTLMLPSSAATLVVCTYLLSSLTILSRWSSKSLGVWPLPWLSVILVFTCARSCARPLMVLTTPSAC